MIVYLCVELYKVLESLFHISLLGIQLFFLVMNFFLQLRALALQALYLSRSLPFHGILFGVSARSALSLSLSPSMSLLLGRLFTNSLSLLGLSVSLLNLSLLGEGSHAKSEQQKCDKKTFHA